MALDPAWAPNTPGPGDLDRLGELLPTGKLLRETEARERYRKDESTRLSALPDAVVLAASLEDVVACLKWAFAGSFPIVTRGSGTGVAGGAVPLGGGVVLSLEKLNRILEFDEDNLTVTCEAGVITADLQREARARGLFYPPDPASAESCTIGGNAAVGAGGALAVKYGTTRDYLLGMRVALADGEVVDLGGKNVKDATGYHLMELLVGSEGTLGVIVEVTLRLIPLPAGAASMLVPFPGIVEAARAVSEIIRLGLNPAVAEFLDEVAIEAATGYLARELPMAGRAGAFVLLSFEGGNPAQLEETLIRAEPVLQRHGALEVLAALDPGQEARIWESRRCLGDAMKKLSPEIGKLDVVVPRASVSELVGRVKSLSLQIGIRIACFGHAGDGNVHVNILREALPDSQWEEKLAAALEGVLGETRRLGGRPSGEHGVGVLKREAMADFLGFRQLRLMRGIKDVFDPKGILNPGKVL